MWLCCILVFFTNGKKTLYKDWVRFLNLWIGWHFKSTKTGSPTNNKDLTVPVTNI